MSGFNLVVLVGNLTRDIEIRYTPAGVAVGTTAIAVNTPAGKNDDGSTKMETMFIDVVLYGRLAEAMNDYLKKGRMVLMKGRLRYRSWEDANGNKRSKHELLVDTVKFLTGYKESSNDNTVEPPPEVNEEGDIPF